MAGASDIRAGRAFVEVYTDKTQLQRGLKTISADLKTFGAGIASLGKKFMVLGAGIVTPLLLASKRFMTFGSELQHMSERTGISTNALSEFGYAAELSGTNIEAVEMAIKRMQNAISTATEGPLKRLQGMSPEEQFMAMADTLNAIQDPTLRAAKALQVFGRGGTSVIPMMKDLRALRAEAVASGRSLGPEAAADAETLNKAWERLGLQLKGIVMTVGGSLAPMLTGVAIAVKDNLAAVRTWISEHKPLVVTLFAAGTAALAAGVGLVVFGKAVTIAGTIIGAFTLTTKAATMALTFMGAVTILLTNPYILLGGAILAVGGYLLYTTGAFRAAGTSIATITRNLANDVTGSLSVMADSMAVGDFPSAAKVGWAVIKMESQKGIAFLMAGWEYFKLCFDTVLTGIQVGFINASAGIQDAWATTTSALGATWAQTLQFMSIGWKSLVYSLKTVGDMLVTWIRVSLLDAFIAVNAAIQKMADSLGPLKGAIPLNLAGLREAGQAALQERANIASAAGQRAAERTMGFGTGIFGEMIEAQRQSASSAAALAMDQKAIEDAAAAQRSGALAGYAARSLAGAARYVDLQNEVTAARAEWEAAKRDAAAKAARARGEEEIPGIGGIDLGAGKGSARGTFSASAVAGLAIGVQEKIAKNTLAMKETLGAIRRELGRLNLEAEA